MIDDLTPDERISCLVGLAAVLNEQGRDWALFATEVSDPVDRAKLLKDLDMQMAITRSAIIKLRRT